MWQTMQVSADTARYELSHLNLHCLQNPLIAFGSERVKTLTMTIFCIDENYIVSSVTIHHSNIYNTETYNKLQQTLKIHQHRMFTIQDR